MAEKKEQRGPLGIHQAITHDIGMQRVELLTMFGFKNEAASDAKASRLTADETKAAVLKGLARLDRYVAGSASEFGIAEQELRSARAEKGLASEELVERMRSSVLETIMRD